MSPRLREYLAAVHAFAEREGYAPSLRDVAQGADSTKASTRDALDRLERLGYIKRTGPRSTRLTAAGLEALAQTRKEAA